MNALKEIRKRENAIPRNSDKPLWAHTNVTRIYNAVVPTKGGEFRVDTYAVKTRNKRTGELAIKKVARYYSDRQRYYVRDVIYHNFMHYYAVNWCNEPFGRRHVAVWEDVDSWMGKWGYCDREDGTIDLGGDWLNWFDGTKYEHCGWSVNSGIKSVAEAFAMLSRLKAHGLAVVLPMNVKQLIDEGNAMHNCIGGMGYYKRICDGKSLIVFLYKDGKPFVDIEIDRERWTVRQCYAKCNTNTEEKINAFAKRICAKAKAIYRKAA